PETQSGTVICPSIRHRYKVDTRLPHLPPASRDHHLFFPAILRSRWLGGFCRTHSPNTFLAVTLLKSCHSRRSRSQGIPTATIERAPHHLKQPTASSLPIHIPARYLVDLYCAPASSTF